MRESVLLPIVVSLLLLGWLSSVSAIIPKACIHNATSTHVCCPSSKYGEDEPGYHHHRGPRCGGPHRGVCVPLEVYRDKVPLEYRMDDRAHWPLTFFTHMCKCHGNFYGVACEECWFGWEGKNCDRRAKVRVRKNWVHMSPREKMIYQKVLVASFHTDSDFFILLEQDNWRSDPLSKPIFIHANWHYFFVVIHRYASRTTLFDSEEQCQKHPILDYNHEGVTFITWHRFFMMNWERALQKIAWEHFHDDTFALPFWDWTDERHCSVCTDDMAGDEGPVDRFGQRYSPKSPFYNWTEYCSEPTDGATCYGCHYSGTFGKLTRRWNNNIMPTTDDLDYVMGFHNFFDHTEKSGEPCKSFHMAVEGFCGPPGVNDTRLYVHNFVHNSLDGSMCCSATATGDPLFIVHHVEIDRIVEAWIRDNKPNLYDFPNSGVRPGHCRECFMAGYLPPVKHGDIFGRSSIEFGYTYENFAFGKKGRVYGTGHRSPPMHYPAWRYYQNHPPDEADHDEHDHHEDDDDRPRYSFYSKNNHDDKKKKKKKKK